MPPPREGPSNPKYLGSITTQLRSTGHEGCTDVLALWPCAHVLASPSWDLGVGPGPSQQARMKFPTEMQGEVSGSGFRMDGEMREGEFVFIWASNSFKYFREIQRGRGGDEGTDSGVWDQDAGRLAWLPLQALAPCSPFPTTSRWRTPTPSPSSHPTQRTPWPCPPCTRTVPPPPRWLPAQPGGCVPGRRWPARWC